jgi:hypothetical protein
MPMLWVSGTNDFAYPLNSLQQSYRLPKGSRTLCVKIRMPHGHGGAGENPPEIAAFADAAVKDGTPLVTLRTQRPTANGSRAAVTFSAASSVRKAELIFTKDRGKWQERNWVATDVAIDGAKGEATADVPAGVTTYYFNLTDDRGLVVSSEHVEVE